MALRSISTLSQEEKTRKKATQQFLADWISKNKDDYIAHAIWEDNVEKVLKHGALVPAEHQLRQHGKVSHEVGMYGLRETTEISSLINEFKEKKIDLPKRFTLENKISLKKAICQGFFKKQFFSVHFQISDEYEEKEKNNEPYFVTLRDGKNYRVTFNDNYGFQDFEIHGISYFEKHNLCVGIKSESPKNYYDLLNDLGKKYKRPASSIEIAIDMLSKNPIDTTLAMLWEQYKKLTFATDHREYAREIFECRKYAIDRSILATNVRAGYKKIWWSYGDIVVLSGDAEEKLSVMSKGLDDRDMQKNIDDVKLLDGQEVFLRHPFENKGQFYTWDLTKEGTIIIGPQNILMPFQTQAKSRGMKLFYIEDMNDAQLKFFNVPQELRPTMIAAKKILSVTSKIEAKNTSLFFNRWHTQTQKEKTKEAADILKIKNFRDVHDKRLITSFFRAWSRETKIAKLMRKIAKAHEKPCSIM